MSHTRAVHPQAVDLSAKLEHRECGNRGVTDRRAKQGAIMKCPIGKCLIGVLGFMVFLSGAGAGELKPYRGEVQPRPLVLSDLAGKPRNLTEFRGQVVLLHFWATWCPTCRAEMPSMWRLKQKFAGKPLAIIAVNLGESEEMVNVFMPERMRQDFTILLDKEGRAAAAWRAFAVPTSYVIDARQSIRYVVVGDVEWDSPRMTAVIDRLISDSVDGKTQSPKPRPLSLRRRGVGG